MRLEGKKIAPSPRVQAGPAMSTHGQGSRYQGFEAGLMADLR